MKLLIPLSILFATILYQFFSLKQIKEAFYNNDSYSEFNCKEYKRNNVATLTSLDDNIISTGYVNKQHNKNDILYDVYINLPNSQGGDYIKESVVYSVMLSNDSSQKKLGDLVRHKDGAYKLSTILPMDSNKLDKVTVLAQIFTDSKPVDTIQILSGSF